MVTVALNILALWKQEPRDRERARRMETAAAAPAFGEAWAALMAISGHANAYLSQSGFGTFGFGMADVLLEPYGGQALGFSVADTTKLTALLAAGTLLGFGLASHVHLGRGGYSAAALGRIGAATGIPGFRERSSFPPAMGGAQSLFLVGTLATGVGAGLFGHATLTAMIRRDCPRRRPAWRSAPGAACRQPVPASASLWPGSFAIFWWSSRPKADCPRICPIMSSSG